MDLGTEINNHVLKLNRDTMATINVKDFKTCQKNLEEAVQVLNNCKDCELKDKLLGITYNNLGCLYRKWKKSHSALKYLQQASRCEKKSFVDNINQAATLLNICAIYSSMNQHEEALKQCKLALELLETIDSSQVYPPTLVIAYHSMAVEHEFLNDLKVSLEFYQLAYDTALKKLGKKHPLTFSIGSDLQKAEKSRNLREVSSIVKEINKEESINRSVRNKKTEVLKKIQNYLGKNSNVKILPYISMKNVNGLVKSGESPIEKRKIRGHTQEKIILKPILEKQTPGKLRSNSPIFTSFHKKRGKIVVPDSLRSSGIKSVFSEQKNSKHQYFNESEASLISENKSGSLRTKTSMLIHDIEQLKTQIHEESSWKYKKHGVKKSNITNLVQALAKAYLTRKH